MNTRKHDSIRTAPAANGNQQDTENANCAGLQEKAPSWFLENQNANHYAKLRPVAHQLCERKGIREEDRRETLCWNVFGSLVEHYAITDPKFYPFFINRLTSRCMNEYAAQARRDERVCPLPDNFDEFMATNTENESTSDFIRLVRQAVETLPADYRLVIHFRYYEDLGVEESAGLLGCSESAIKARAFRARKMLADLLLPHIINSRGILTAVLDAGRDSCLSHLQQTVNRAIKTLNPHYQKLIRLYHRAGTPFPRIAAQLGISEPLVRIRVSRAHDQLAKALIPSLRKRRLTF
jgi:RNA polymerase sigma factor (sigma-70 family)